LLRHALEHPQRDYTANVHASKHAVTLQTALTDLRRVEQLGLLRATRRGKTFYFRAVPDLDDRVRRGPHA
jgi:hypothetical protein